MTNEQLIRANTNLNGYKTVRFYHRPNYNRYVYTMRIIKNYNFGGNIYYCKEERMCNLT